MTKMRFTDLDAPTQDAVLENRSIPHLEQAITSAATSANQDELTRLTLLYNEARGLPTTPPTTDTPDTPYAGEAWDRDSLRDEADSRGLAVEGTGKDGYVTKANYRDALVADDGKGAS